MVQIIFLTSGTSDLVTIQGWTEIRVMRLCQCPPLHRTSCIFTHSQQMSSINHRADTKPTSNTTVHFCLHRHICEPWCKHAFRIWDLSLSIFDSNFLLHQYTDQSNVLLSGRAIAPYKYLALYSKLLFEGKTVLKTIGAALYRLWPCLAWRILIAMFSRQRSILRSSLTARNRPSVLNNALSSERKRVSMCSCGGFVEYGIPLPFGSTNLIHTRHSPRAWPLRQARHKSALQQADDPLRVAAYVRSSFQ